MGFSVALAHAQNGLLLLGAGGKVAAGGGGGSITQVQRKSYFSIASNTIHTITPDSAVTSGHLCLLAVDADDNVTTPGGWTQDATTTDFTVLKIYRKTCAGTEGAGIAVTIASSTSLAAVFFEYSNMAASSQLDSTVGSINGQGPTSFATGTTGTTTQANDLVLAAVGIPAGGGPNITSWSNSFVLELCGATTNSGNNVYLCTASRIVSATGTYTTAGTTLNAGTTNGSGAIAAYKGQ